MNLQKLSQHFRSHILREFWEISILLVMSSHSRWVQHGRPQAKIPGLSPAKKKRTCSLHLILWTLFQKVDSSSYFSKATTLPSKDISGEFFKNLYFLYLYVHRRYMSDEHLRCLFGVILNVPLEISSLWSMPLGTIFLSSPPSRSKASEPPDAPSSAP